MILVSAMLVSGWGLAETLHDEMWENLPDPTRPYRGFVAPSTEQSDPAAPAVERTSALTLQSVVTGPQVRYAFINGHRVEVGGSVDRARVVAIQPHEVIVDVQGQIQVLRLVRESPKRERP
jgi:hypothetical protein